MGHTLLLLPLLLGLLTFPHVKGQEADYGQPIDYQHFEGYQDYQEYLPQYASERASTDAANIQSQLEAEIVKLERETKLEKRYQNFLKYEKIFLRLAATGTLALGRNILFGETRVVFQGDDDEEDAPDDNESRSFSQEQEGFLQNFSWDDDTEDLGSDWDQWNLVSGRSNGLGTGRANFVPQFPGEPLFNVPAWYLLQVIGRTLQQAGFAGPTVLGLQSLDVSCGRATLIEVVEEYSFLFSPASSGIPKGLLQFYLNKFSRELSRKLGCLTGSENLGPKRRIFLQGQLKRVLGKRIGREAVEGASQLGGEIEAARQEVSRLMTETSSQLAADWLNSSAVTLALLLLKLAGFTLIALGRNINDFPTDAVWEAGESQSTNGTNLQTFDTGIFNFGFMSHNRWRNTAHRLNLIGRTSLVAIFTVDDFRKLLTYEPPECDFNTLDAVLTSHSSLINAPQGGEEEELEMEELRFEAKEAVSCLTSTPKQFIGGLATLKAGGKGKELEDRLDDLLDLVQLQLNGVL